MSMQTGVGVQGMLELRVKEVFRPWRSFRFNVETND